MSARDARGAGGRGVLVAGLGNIFLGDDGFGVEVARRLAGAPLAPDVEVADVGVRGIHLAYELTGGRYHTAILVDAMPRGSAPGTLYLVEPEEAAAADAEPADAHTLTPAAVVAWVQRLGGASLRLLVVGCEPAVIEEGIGLSRPVAAAVDDAVEMIRRLIREMTPAAMSSGGRGDPKRLRPDRTRRRERVRAGAGPRAE